MEASEEGSDDVVKFNYNLYCKNPLNPSQALLKHLQKISSKNYQKYN